MSNETTHNCRRDQPRDWRNDDLADWCCACEVWTYSDDATDRDGNPRRPPPPKDAQRRELLAPRMRDNDKGRLVWPRGIASGVLGGGS